MPDPDPPPPPPPKDGAAPTPGALRTGRTHRITVPRPKPTKLTAVKLLSLAFGTDHGALCDNDATWATAGVKFSDKDPREWVREPAHSFPISHTKGEALAVTVEFEATPAEVPPATGEVKATGKGDHFSFEGTGSFPAGSPGEKVKVTITAKAKLPDQIAKHVAEIAWKVKVGGEEFDAGPSGPHTIYATFGPPIEGGEREDGATSKRMAKAVEMIGAVGSLDPHTIVAAQMKKFKYYTLKRNSSVPEEFGHPQFFNAIFGAWPMADHMSATGECQAIVRFVRGLLRQVNCPGDAKTVVVWADPEVEDGKKALEREHGKGGGLRGSRKRQDDGTWWYGCLVDKDPIKEGQVFKSGEIGLNNFEACLRFDHGGKVKYYGGGAGVFDKAEDVLNAFYALCWVSMDTGEDGNDIVTIRKIVRRF